MKILKNDFLYTLAFLSLVIFISFNFNLDFMEKFYFFTREYEKYELDELITSIVLGSIFIIYYAYRRAIDIISISKKNDWLLNHDSLTGVKNRFHLLKLIEKIDKNPQIDSISISIINIDNFNKINNHHGYEFGDKLLKCFAKRISSLAEINKGTILYRLGCDEFLVIYYNSVNKFDSKNIFNHIKQSLNSPFLIDNKIVHINHRQGVALYPGFGRNLAETINHAEFSMQYAKRKYNESLFYFDIESYITLKKKLKLEDQIVKSFLNNELYILFQPITEVETMDIVGFEALVRCCIDSKMVNPELIVETLESKGFSSIFLKWLILESLKESCEFQKDNQYLSINLTSSQILSDDFLLIVNDINKKTNKQIRFEITEQSVITQYEKLSDIQVYLEKLCIPLMIDDFGTGYSSMERLNNLAVTTVKVDKSFLDITCLKTKLIFESILNIAKLLNIEVIVEGVESEEQYQYIRNFPGIKMQGYYFSPPLKRCDLENIYRGG